MKKRSLPKNFNEGKEQRQVAKSDVVEEKWMPEDLIVSKEARQAVESDIIGEE